MEQLLEQIHRVEHVHLIKLYNHLVKVFGNTNLPSHDAQHHLRVWLHCRGLLIELHKLDATISEELIENTLIACFFHDSGLTVDIGEVHGKHGGQICRDYYLNHPEYQIKGLDAIVQAIEFHDDKSTKSATVNSLQDMTCLDRLVSTADDLDALGIIGIFRYIEIYLKRGVSDKELSKKIIQNLRSRFTSFTNAYSSLQKFTDKQRVRYLEAINFFTELDYQIAQGTDNPDSQFAVFKTLKEQLVEKNHSINQTLEYALKHATASYPAWFFNAVRNELNVTTAILIG